MMKMWQLESNLKVKLLRAELEDQEKSLKASVAAQVQLSVMLKRITTCELEQEKKAHENWVAARQAERRLTEVLDIAQLCFRSRRICFDYLTRCKVKCRC